MPSTSEIELHRVIDGLSNGHSTLVDLLRELEPFFQETGLRNLANAARAAAQDITDDVRLYNVDRDDLPRPRAKVAWDL